MVRSVTFEIRWHDTQPIYSCSFQPISPNHLKRVLDHNLGQAAGLAPGKTLGEAAAAAGPSSASGSTPSKNIQPPITAGGQSWRLATAGGDNNARLWMVHPNIPSPAALASAASTSVAAAIAPHPPRVEYLATLSRHSGVVNVVRFCPKGELLATAGDDGNVLFWVPSDRTRPKFGDVHPSLDDGETQFEKEFWRVKLMTRATPQELYDMAWSPNGETLAVGGTDFVARIINVQDGHVIREISEHNHYVQGIAWDPLQEFIATQSSDRVVHIHSLPTKQKHELGESGSSTAISGSHLVSRASKLDLHRRNGSGNGTFIWDANAKPPMKRRASSHASQASDSEGPRESFVAGIRGRSKRSSTPMEVLHPPSIARASTPQIAGPSSSGGPARPATPTPGASVPLSPFSTTSAAAGVHAMNPPQTTPSRRSSFSGSNMDIASPPTSATSLAPTSIVGSSGKPASSFAEISASAPPAPASDSGRHRGGTSRSASRARSIRSPSPIPPLPAIRAPPSPKQRMQAAAALVGDGQVAKSSMRLYGDENFSGFFRRLSFSPDGALLVTPSGLFDPPPASPMSPRKSPSIPVAQGSKSAVYLYTRGNFSRSNAPIAVLPGHKTATLVVRFSPILYELRKSGGQDDGIAPHPTIPLEVGKHKSVPLKNAGSGPSVIGLPYRMVYAVATQDSVWIYDTQQTGPICCFSNMHYASFTDLTWSPDGQTLMMSSTDGYCSVVVFDYAELGVPYQYSAQPSLLTPSAGTPAPAHIATGGGGVSARSAPNTPQLGTTSLPDESTTGLGLALPEPNQLPVKKKRRIAPTLQQ